MIHLSFKSKEAYEKLQSFLKTNKEFKFTIPTMDGGEYFPEYIIKGELPYSTPSKNVVSSDLSIDTKLLTYCWVETENYEIRGIPNNMISKFEDLNCHTIDDWYYERFNAI